MVIANSEIFVTWSDPRDSSISRTFFAKTAVP
jgi:hypothetical protein